MYKILAVIPPDLLVHEALHGVLGFVFALPIWYKTKSYKLVILVIVLAYLVDLDHLIDYFIYLGFRFNLKSFFEGQQFQNSKHAIILFHAWEWLIILLIINLRKKWNSIWRALLMAYSSHMLLDVINVGSILFYSIIYRLLNGFRF